MSEDQKTNSAVDRWRAPQNSGEIEALQQTVRKRRMALYFALTAAAALLVIIGVLTRSGKKSGSGVSTPPIPPRPKNPPATARAALPTKLEEIRKLESNPTNPVIKISTSKGSMLVELYEDKVPNTVANMVELAEKGFYKGMAFHRIIPGFMAQGGCPYSKQGATGRPGTGGPGYNFANECTPELKHDSRGILSMANAGPDTNGSQFFLCFAPAPHLNGKHTVFGKVIAGEDVLDALEKIGTPSGQPKETVRFNIEVVAKQDHDYHVKKL